MIVVGNGASLLDAAHGAFIDEHDIVVRFNLFTIEGFSRHVGTKTTFWFSNRGADSKHVESRLRRHVFERIYVHTWRNTATAVQSFVTRLPERSEAPKIILVDKSDIREMAAFLGNGYRMFSTGAIGVWMLLQEYQFLTLVGFDWWHRPPKFHYSDASTFNYDNQKGHKPVLEKSFLEKLRNEQRLTIHL